jgi:hypothetical protein
VLAGFLVFLRADGPLPASAQSPQERQELHSLLSHTMLTPPLRSPEVFLRFSPDGKYLLLQDPTGVTVFRKSPLSILLHVSAEFVYPAEFSADSQSVVLVSRGLNFARWKLPTGEKIADGDLPSKEDCLDGQLSPGGEFFACLKPDFVFALFEVATQKSVLEESASPALPLRAGGLRSLYPVAMLFFSSLDFDSAFSGPFGIVRTAEPKLNRNHSLSSSSIHFSPDAKVLLAGFAKASFVLDITAKKKFEPHGTVQRVLDGVVALPASDRLISIEKSKSTPPESSAALFSLSKGNELARLPLSADRIRMASSPRFVILFDVSPDGPSAAAFDLEQNRPLDTPPAVTLDVHGEDLAVYTVGGSIALYRLGQRNLLANLPLPLATLPLPRCASLTPNLDKLALSVDGVGAVFDMSSGHRLVTLPRFDAVNFLDGQEAFLFFPRFRNDPAHIARVMLRGGTVSPSWEIGKEQQLRPGGPVLLDYFWSKPTNAFEKLSSPEMQAPYTLRALDPASGKELWKREFKDNPPTPFADPQGERLVLGWKAKTSQAKSAASRNPVMYEIYKKAKLTDHDSFFEALDARSGISVGGVLVTVGNGPTTFDTAFSVGGVMILIKDGVRVSIYSLRDGLLKARLVGNRPSASTEANLLALDLGGGRLGIYDLSTGTKLDEQLFPEGLAYSHFSPDGKRLFVLTEHQTAAIIDVNDVRNVRGKIDN